MFSIRLFFLRNGNILCSYIPIYALHIANLTHVCIFKLIVLTLHFPLIKKYERNMTLSILLTYTLHLTSSNFVHNRNSLASLWK